MRMYGLRVPRFDPFRWAQKNSFETVYRPLRLAYGYFARMADGTPVVILSSTIKDPRRLNGTMGHEGGHVVTAPNGMVGLHVGSRSTMGRVAPASWAEIKGLLEAEDDERDGATIQFACSESSLLLPNKWRLPRIDGAWSSSCQTISCAS